MRRKELWTKTLTAVLAAAMVTSVSPAVPAFAVTGSQVAADGTYTAKAEVTGDGQFESYNIETSVSVKDGKIADITVTPDDAYDEDDNGQYYKYVKEGRTRKGVQYPGYTSLSGKDATTDTIASWDTVSGATILSNAVKSSLTEALANASETGGTDTPDTPEEEARYITMNVPYTAFYKAYSLTDSAVWEVESGVDAVSTATTNKFKGTTGLAKGTYNDGKYIKGVTIPVKVSAEDYKKLTTGLADTADYYFTDLAEAPAAYSELTVGSDGTYSFSKFADSALTIDNAKVSEAELDGSYGDYQISLEGITPDGKVTVNGEEKTLTTYGAILNTSAGNLGMTCLENLWFGTRVKNMEIAWSIKGGKGLQRAHGNGGEFYQFDANGATLNSVTLITDQGLITINDGQKLAEYYTGDLSGLNYALENDSKELNISGIPSELKDVKISVSGGLTSEGKEVKDGKVELDKAPTAGTSYTITISSSNYPDITRTTSTPITSELKASLQKLIDKAQKTSGYESNADLQEHVKEAQDMLADKSAKSADAAELIGELEDKIKATYPTANATATLKGTKLAVQLDGVELSALENPIYTLSYRNGRRMEILTSGKLKDLSFALEKTPTVGTAYTLTIESDNYQDITTTVTAEEAAVESEYSYVYVGMSWAEYWKNEGVLNAGSETTSDAQDSHDEYDKGAFDAVTRATTNHGLHRGSFQCNAVVETKDGKTYNLAYWTDKDHFMTTDGETVDFAAIKTADNLKEYKVTGLKYVPVKVKTADLSALKEKYAVVENGGTLRGGFGEGGLTSYEVTAEVTDKTNGLKEATKNADGSFEFSAKVTGTDSGIKGQELKTATNVEAVLRKNTRPEGDRTALVGSFGEFIRLDILGDGYGDLGSNMQSVKWEYYGTDRSNTTPLATFGTKFASDNWMHKSMGIQLGLTESERCQLPAGTDGTGHWKVTISALGYEDYTVEFDATKENLATFTPVSEAIKAALTAKVEEADKLNEADYTAESWANLQTELQESKELLAKENLLESEASEQVTHLTEALNNLVKADVDISKLQESVEEADALKESDYTEESWAAFQSAYANAKAALEAKDSVTAVNEAQAALDQAIAALVQKAADKTALDNTVRDAENTDKYKESDYTKDSWKALQDALKTAKEVMEKDSPLQSEVDAANDALAKAVEGLEVPNTASIDKAIKDAEGLKESDYTADSWKALQTALQNAKTALEEKKSQAVLDDAANKLNETIRGLKKKSANSIKTSSTSKGNTTGSGTSASGKTSENGGVKTGDTANVLGLLGAAVASLGAAGTSLRFRRKNKKK